MKKIYLHVILLFSLTSILSCTKARYEIESVTGRTIPMDAHWDEKTDTGMMAVLEQYKAGIDSIMNIPIGESVIPMEKGRPQGLLSNFTADMLYEKVKEYSGKPVDFALLNDGGLRTSLNQGKVTTGNIYSIFPFENSLCYLALKGSDVTKLFEKIAERKGEPVSSQIEMVIGPGYRLEKLLINGNPVDTSRVYHIATIDYLTDGNDEMTALMNAVEHTDIEIRLRDAMMEYIKEKNAKGEKLNANLDKRIIYNFPDDKK